MTRKAFLLFREEHSSLFVQCLFCSLGYTLSTLSGWKHVRFNYINNVHYLYIMCMCVCVCRAASFYRSISYWENSYGFSWFRAKSYPNFWRQCGCNATLMLVNTCSLTLRRPPWFPHHHKMQHAHTHPLGGLHQGWKITKYLALRSSTQLFLASFNLLG